ncbi:MAG: hypothetical protein MUP99_10845 [Pedobacter sp.]|nr:hypothetical protein [Pedobacter sp.]
MVGTGVINNKFVLIYNDQYNKYFEDKYREFGHIKVSTYTLLPQYTVSSNGRVTVLSANSQAVRAVTFSMLQST